MRFLKHLVTAFIILTAIMSDAQDKIEITANGRAMTATFADSDAAREFMTKLESNPVTVTMNDYGGFEKVGDLPWSLPASNNQIPTSAGYIMLYLGHCMVIFYGSNSWAYTPLGRIDGASDSEIRDFLSGNSIKVTFSKEGQSAIDDIAADIGISPEVYNLQGRKISLAGRKISDLPKGIYIIDGKKRLIR